jgi:hypothetical protein
MAMPKKPRLSANKMGEYLIVGPARRRRILYDAKFPSDAVVPYYQPAAEAIAQFIAGGMADLGILEKKAKTLGAENPTSVWHARRNTGNIDALENFEAMLDDIDLKGATPSLGAHQAPPISYAGVDVSVRPDVILELNGKVGGIKLHFPKSNPLNQDAAGYVSAMTFEYCKLHLTTKGTSVGNFCMVIDVASGKFFPGATSTKARLKDVAAACGEVFALWPSIQP